MEPQQQTNQSNGTSMPPQPEATQEDLIARGDLVRVVDTNAAKEPILPDGKQRPRVHEFIVRGQLQKVAFVGAGAKTLPRLIAARFLRDPAFIRVDANGQQIEWDGAVPEQPNAANTGAFVLKNDETVARLSELTVTALGNRVALLTGGEEILRRKEVSREMLVQFLVQEQDRLQKLNSSVERHGEDEFTPAPLTGEEY